MHWCIRYEYEWTLKSLFMSHTHTQNTLVSFTRHNSKGTYVHKYCIYNSSFSILGSLFFLSFSKEKKLRYKIIIVIAFTGSTFFSPLFFFLSAVNVNTSFSDRDYSESVKQPHLDIKRNHNLSLQFIWILIRTFGTQI